MKKYYLALIAILILVSEIGYSQQKVDTLNNEKIIQLTKINLAPNVIVGKIKTSVCVFDVSTDALIKLNENKVDPNVLAEMITANTKQQTIEGSTMDLKNPLSMRDDGIYYYDKNDVDHPIKKIDASVIGNEKEGGGSYEGISHSKSTASLVGEYSQTQIIETSPVFYFYFNKDNSNGSNEFLTAHAETPKEFVLVKFDISRNSRYFKTGGSTGVSSFGGSSIGIPDKDKVPFHYDKVAEGIYKVTFSQPLQGEYCFTYSSRITKLFDFGIYPTIDKKQRSSMNNNGPNPFGGPPNPFQHQKKEKTEDTKKSDDQKK